MGLPSGGKLPRGTAPRLLQSPISHSAQLMTSPAIMGCLITRHSSRATKEAHPRLYRSRRFTPTGNSPCSNPWPFPLISPILSLPGQKARTPTNFSPARPRPVFDPNPNHHHPPPLALPYAAPSRSPSRSSRHGLAPHALQPCRLKRHRARASALPHRDCQHAGRPLPHPRRPGPV